MSTSPDLGLPLIENQQNQPEVVHNEALLLLQAVLNGVLDRGINAPPGSPNDGDVYIVGAAPTGAWTGRANALAGWFDDGSGTSAWRFLPGDDSDGNAIAMGARQEGLSVWVRDEDARYTWDGAAWAQESGGVSGSIYDFGFVFEDTPAAGAVLQRVRLGRAVTIPADMAGSAGGVATNPDAQFDIDVRDDGVSIGTISVSAAGAVTFATAGSPPPAVNVAAGSEITFVAPAASPPEATIAGGSFVILATVQ